MTTFDEYQKRAMSTALWEVRDFSLSPLAYCAMKINGEAGEVAEKIAKSWRDDRGIVTNDRREAIIAELGDVLWYLTAIAHLLDTSLEHVAQVNESKLASRLKRGVLGGDGDNR